MGQSILVIEDEITIANLLKLELRAEGYDVTTAYDGFAGLETARTHSFDLILLDWMLPGVTGVEICQRIRKTDQAIPIVFLTSQAEVSDRIAGLDAGADDYVTKPFSMDELLARVRCNLRRTNAVEASEILEYNDLKLDRYRRLAYRDRHEIELTTKEFNLLEYFLLHPEKVVSRQTILEQVWQWGHGNDDSVVEIYVRRLRKKLESSQQERILQTVRGVGYVLRHTS
ncbi:MAG: response regulator transcription factor [Cyanobacteria bacterium P01_F01_bin.150]